MNIGQIDISFTVVFFLIIVTEKQMKFCQLVQ